MAVAIKTLLISGLVLFDLAVLLALVRVLFRKGLRFGIIVGLLAVAAILFAAGTTLNKAVPLPQPAIQQSAGAVNRKVVGDIRDLFHQTPDRVEKILGKPDGPIKPMPDNNGKQVLKSGRKVPAASGMYMGGVVQVTYLDNKAARVWIVLKGPHTFPDDVKKAASAFGIPIGKTAVKKPYGFDWPNPGGGIYRVQINVTDGRAAEIGVIFLAAEDIL